MHFELRQLRHFVAVAESETLTSAAERLFMTQSALSMSIRRLEESLGVRLFARVGRRLLLTNEGERLLEDARAVLRSAERLQSRASALRAGKSHLRVGFCDPGPYWYLVPKIAPYFSDCRFEPVLACGECTLERLLDESFDVLVAADVAHRADIEIEPFAVDRLLLSVPVERIEHVRFAACDRLSELRDAELFVLEVDGPLSEQSAQLRRTLDPSVNVKLFHDYFFFQQALAEKPVLTFTTTLVSSYRRDEGERMLLPIADPLAAIRYDLVRRAGDQDSLAARFCRLARQLAADEIHAPERAKS